MKLDNLILSIYNINFFLFTVHLGFNTLFVQNYSVICRPLDHTVGRPGPRFEPGTADLQARTLTTGPPHLLKTTTPP